MAAQLPPRFTEIKRSIAAANPNFEQDITNAWSEVLAELDKVTKTIAKEGSAVNSPLILSSWNDDVDSIPVHSSSVFRRFGQAE
jgi:hypothetical protein